VQNLPLGVFSRGDGARRIATAIGDHVLDLAGLAEDGALPQGLSPRWRSLRSTRCSACPRQTASRCATRCSRRCRANAAA
jgi:hypothetical protein